MPTTKQISVQSIKKMKINLLFSKKHKHSVLQLINTHFRVNSLSWKGKFKTISIKLTQNLQINN